MSELKCGTVVKWLNTAVCKTVIRGFEPHRFLQKNFVRFGAENYFKYTPHSLSSS